jgi:hypothetical protein
VPLGNLARNAASGKEFEWLWIGRIQQPAMRPQCGQLVQLAILRNMRRKWDRVPMHRRLYVVNCSIVLPLEFLIAEQATGPTRPAPVATGWSTARARLGPDVVPIPASTAVWTRADVLARAPIDQAHACNYVFQAQICNHW